MPSTSTTVAWYPGTGTPVDPGTISSSAAEMKMCSISVDPMPSMILTPVASWNAFQVATGRCSPADTQRRRLDKPAVASPAIIALYAVGAVKQIVTPCSAMCRASSAGVAFSMSSVDAPTRRGKTTRPPSPNVKASGGVPVNTSSGVGRST